VCPKCGAPWVRITKKGLTSHDGNTECLYEQGTSANRLALSRQAARERGEEYSNGVETTGWVPSCNCKIDFTVPATVIDPFNGSGATGVACKWHNRRYIGIELKPEYVKMAEERIKEGK